MWLLYYLVSAGKTETTLIVVVDVSLNRVFDCRPAWVCPNCDSCYDHDEIEYQLLDALQRKAVSFTLQDLQCVKCRQVNIIEMQKI